MDTVRSNSAKRITLKTACTRMIYAPFNTVVMTLWIGRLLKVTFRLSTLMQTPLTMTRALDRVILTVAVIQITWSLVDRLKSTPVFR